MPKAIMGTTEECLKHLADTYPADAVRPALAEFCKVETSTAGRWLNGRNLPKGDEVISLSVFLQLAGYSVLELAELPRKSRQLAQVIAVGVLSPDEVKDRLGYRNTQDVYRMLRGSNPVAERQRKLDRLVEDFEEELGKRLTLWKARIEDLLEGTPSGQRRLVDSTEPLAAPASQAEVATVVVEVAPAEVIDHLVAALSAALDNGDQPGRPGVPEPLPRGDQRQAILDRIGSDRFSRLTAQLEMLNRS